MRNTQRALKTDHVAMIQQIEKDQPGDTAAILPHIMGTNAHAAYSSGEYEKAMLSCGQGVIFADRIEPFAAIVDRIEAEASAALARIDGLRAAPQSAVKTKRA
jgi:nitronate monooxygenase